MYSPLRRRIVSAPRSEAVETRKASSDRCCWVRRDSTMLAYALKAATAAGAGCAIARCDPARSSSPAQIRVRKHRFMRSKLHHSGGQRNACNLKWEEDCSSRCKSLKRRNFPGVLAYAKAMDGAPHPID